MKKIIFLFILIGLFVFPTVVSAKTIEAAQQILDTFDDEITVDIANPDILGTYKTYTKDSLLASNPDYYGEFSDEELDQMVVDINKASKGDYLFAMFEFYLKKNKPNYYAFDDVYAEFSSNDELKLIAWYNEENGFSSDSNVTKNIRFVYKDVNQSEYNKAKNILDSLKSSYSISGMNSINALYHYGELLDADYDNGGILGRFSELKNIIENNPEYTFEIIPGPGGGSPGMQSRNIYIGIYKDNYLYCFRTISLTDTKVLFVDKDLSGSPEEKALSRLRNYFNNKVNISIDSSKTEDYNDELYYFKNRFNDDNIISATGISVTIGNKKATISVLETSKENVDKMYAESVDISTGINVYTESYDVPVDAVLKTSDVSSSDYVKKAALNYNLNLLKAFDLNLFKGFNNVKISTIENGIEVYFPVEGEHAFEIYYIKNNGTLGENLKSELVIISGKKYLKFVTNHFSTFGISDGKASLNPNTSDKMNNYIFVLCLSCGALYMINRIKNSI